MTATAQVTTPEWVTKLRGLAGEECPYVSIPEAAPFLPGCDSDRWYRMASRYVARIAAERGRRKTQLLPLEVLDARQDELPAMRDGRSVYLHKDLLVRRLTGWEVES